MGAVAVYREGLGICGNGACSDDGQTDQRSDDDVVHSGSLGFEYRSFTSSVFGGLAGGKPGASRACYGETRLPTEISSSF